jgi:hypothetical protein
MTTIKIMMEIDAKHFRTLVGIVRRLKQFGYGYAAPVSITPKRRARARGAASAPPPLHTIHDKRRNSNACPHEKTRWVAPGKKVL